MLLKFQRLKLIFSLRFHYYSSYRHFCSSQVVADCIKKNRAGLGGDYENLAFVIHERTREAVGEWHWTRVKLIILYARQSSRKRNRPGTTTSSATVTTPAGVAPSRREVKPEYKGGNKTETARMQVASRTA